MTRNDYIQKLTAELRSFDKAQKNEILQEIEGLISDSGCPDDELFQRFGSPEELAISYEKNPSLTKQNLIFGFAKNLVLGIGTITTKLIAIGTYFFGSIHQTNSITLGQISLFLTEVQLIGSRFRSIIPPQLNRMAICDTKTPDYGF